MTTFASAVFISLFIATFAFGLLCGRSWGRWEIHNDPIHIDRLARKDHRIAELEHSNAKLKMQRDKSLEAYRRLRDEQRSAL